MVLIRPDQVESTHQPWTYSSACSSMYTNDLPSSSCKQPNRCYDRFVLRNWLHYWPGSSRKSDRRACIDSRSSGGGNHPEWCRKTSASAAPCGTCGPCSWKWSWACTGSALWAWTWIDSFFRSDYRPCWLFACISIACSVEESFWSLQSKDSKKIKKIKSIIT